MVPRKFNLNLIDILKTILNTKNEIKDIINSDNESIGLNNDFAKYAYTVYNYLADKYNQGYVSGYADYYQENVGVSRYPDKPLLLREYLPISGENYDPYTVDGLTDIMRDNLGFREDIRDSIAEFSETVNDSFINYPEYLQFLKDSLYSTGYDDGQEAASDTIIEQETVNPPTAEYDDNTLTLEPTQQYQVLWFKIGENGVEIRYEKPVYVPYDCTIYYWSTIGQAISDGDKNAHWIECEYTPPVEITDEKPFIRPPEISFENDRIILKNVNSENTTMEYCINPDDENSQWKQYTGPIGINTEMDKIAVRAYSNEGILSTVDTANIPQTEETGDPEQPTITLVPPAAPVCEYDFDNKTVVLSCETEGAGIQYVIDSGDWVEYTQSFTIPQRIVILYARSYIDYGEYGIYYTSTGYRLSGYTLDLRKPNISTLSDGKVYISTGMAGSTIKYAVTDNENDPITSWTEITATSGSFTLDDDKWVHAKTIYNGRESEVTHYYYNYYSTTYTLDPPTYTFENNTLMISSPYTVYYTTDGSDPRYNREHMWSGSLTTYGLPITETTTVSAVAVEYNEEDDSIHYSTTVSWVLTPTDDIENSNEFFYVKGVNGISISGTSLYWSYDKVNWTYFSDCSGLDPSQTVYLRSGANGVNNIGTFSFTGDSVEVGGNIISLFKGVDFMNNQEINPSLSGLFKNCTNLRSAYNLVIPNTMCYNNQYYEMFRGCSNLIAAPKELYFNIIGAYGCEYMFKGCTKLESTPIMNVTEVYLSGFEEMFSGCTSMLSCNVNLNLNKISTSGCRSMFDGCTQLSFINMTVNEDCELSSEAFKYMFTGTSLVNHNIKLNATNLVSKCYIQMFSGCGLTRFGNLPATEMKDMCYWRMFENCTQLWQFGNIEATILANSCFEGMFDGCIRLENAPVLKAQSLVGGCYNYMFQNCSRLNFIKATFLTDPIDGNTHPFTWNWVNGVANTGVFVQNTDATWYERGVHAIPVNWTVEGSDISSGTILSVNVNIDKVTIYASNDDQIQYQFNSQDGNWINYNGEFPMTTNSATIYARCINSRGIPGEVFSQNISCENFPVIPVNVNNNIITLENPNNIYTKVYYCFEEYGGGSKGPWLVYSQPIDVGYGKQGRINARGITSGGIIGGQTYRDYVTVEENNIPTPQIWVEYNKVYISTDERYSIRYYKSTDPDRKFWYYNPIPINEDEEYVITAYYVDEYKNRRSPVVATLYVYYNEGENKVDTPVITYYDNIVTITCPTSDSVIYYTTDGTTPTTSSNIYTSPITITATTTFKAIGVRTGWINSEVETQECIYVPVHDYSKDFFTITNIGETDNCTLYVNTYYINSTILNNLYYKKGNQSTWNKLNTIIHATIAEIPLNIGESVQFKVSGLSGINSFRYFESSEVTHQYAAFSTVGDRNRIIEVSGNISSLIRSSTKTDEFEGPEYTDWPTSIGEKCFESLFFSESCLYSAKNLVINVRSKWCYYQMFMNCSNLVYAPNIIDISNTNIYTGICSDMFKDCTKLEFAPSLPSTVTFPYCYKQMFQGCTSLTTAPELPSEILTESCYNHMFENSGVNYIKCLATNISATDCTNNWLWETAESGTFVKNPNMSSWSTGPSGIPNNWTIEDNN